MLCCQVYTQPIYSLYEDRIRTARGGEDMPVPMQFGLRNIYVLLITLVALLIPFFGSLMGLVGAVAITPLEVVGNNLPAASPYVGAVQAAS